MRTFKELFQEELEEKMTPAQMMMHRRKMGRRMKILAKKSSVKMKKARMKLRRRDNDALQAIAKRQAKQMVIKRSLAQRSTTKNSPCKNEFRLTKRLSQRSVRLLIRFHRRF